MLNILNDSTNITLANLSNIDLFKNVRIDINEVIELDWHNINPNTFFTNWTDIANKHKNLNPKQIAKLEKHRIYLTKKGVNSIMYLIPFDKWTNKDDFIDFNEKLKSSYFEMIEQKLKNDDTKIHSNEPCDFPLGKSQATLSKKSEIFLDNEPEPNYKLIKEMKKTEEMLNLASNLDLQDKYFEELKPKMERLGLEFEKYFHPIIPLIRKTTSKTHVNYTKFQKILKEKYKNNVIPQVHLRRTKNDLKPNEFICVVPYTKLITKKQMENYLSMDDEKFKNLFN